MYEYKLQLGCFLIVLYFCISYLRATFNNKYECNKYFDALLLIAPWEIIFDGVTAWTVNRQDIVPDWLNLLLHCLFFLTINAVIIIVFLYTVDQTIGIGSRKKFFILLTPGIVSQTLIIAFIWELAYLPGKTTYYSMGISVVICYASLFLHGLGTILSLIVHRRTLEKAKLYDMGFFYILVVIFMICQALVPEALVSSLFPTLSIIGIYISFENPALRHLHKYNEEMVAAFATLVENRDNSTGGHIKRTRGYVKILLSEMRRNPSYKEMTEDYIQSVKRAAPIHDIGKISTPDRILQKPGKLTDEEYALMKQHANVGGEIIKKTFSDMDSPEYQEIAYEVAKHHHEKWNGKGYPDGLKGEEIPLHARVMAIADVFDAVSAKRCYRDALPIEECLQIIRDGSGTDFDPNLVEIFMNAKDKIIAYYEAEKDI